MSSILVCVSPNEDGNWLVSSHPAKHTHDTSLVETWHLVATGPLPHILTGTHCRVVAYDVPMHRDAIHRPQKTHRLLPLATYVCARQVHRVFVCVCGLRCWGQQRFSLVLFWEQCRDIKGDMGHPISTPSIETTPA